MEMQPMMKRIRSRKQKEHRATLKASFILIVGIVLFVVAKAVAGVV